MLKRLFGFTRMANVKAVMRLFRKFTQSTNESVMDSLYQWLFGQIAINGIILDLDCKRSINSAIASADELV